MTTAIAPHRDQGPDDPDEFAALLSRLAPELAVRARRIAGYRSAADLTRDTVPAGLWLPLADELPPVGGIPWADPSESISEGGGR